jgi:uncharacterized protein DUF3224
MHSDHRYATGAIDVKTYEPTPYDQPAEGPALVRIHVVETFSGDIEGEGIAEFLQTTGGDGEASFVGVERVTGSIGGRSGTFVLQDQGMPEPRREKASRSSPRLGPPTQA